MIIKFGWCQAASDAFLKMGLAARLGQTIGNAPASAGTHAQDGTECGHPYCAATDLHVSDLGFDEVRKLLGELADHGFAAFFRRPGFDHWPSFNALHIHAVYAGIPMKPALQGQVHDWLHGRNGLASHASYEF